MIKILLPSLVLFCIIALALPSAAQKEMPLYPGAIPNSLPVANLEETGDQQTVKYVSNPTLTVYLPEQGKANGTAVIVCPGGGYASVVMQKEGFKIAEQLAKSGITAFILKYRLPNSRTMADKSIGPLQDAQQAIKTVREKASEYGIDPNKIGMMGYSAGGHLASTAGTHFTTPLIENKKGTSLRPDFMILVYPVTSFQENLLHKGCVTNLLGESPSKEKLLLYSNELQVTKSTPPTILLHASDDVKVPVGNSVVFYEALQKVGVPAELHIYSKGGHGFGAAPAFDEWYTRCINWVKETGFLP